MTDDDIQFNNLDSELEAERHLTQQTRRFINHHRSNSRQIHHKVKQDNDLKLSVLKTQWFVWWLCCFVVLITKVCFRIIQGIYTFIFLCWDLQDMFSNDEILFWEECIMVLFKSWNFAYRLLKSGTSNCSKTLAIQSSSNIKFSAGLACWTDTLGDQDIYVYS